MTRPPLLRRTRHPSARPVSTPPGFAAGGERLALALVTALAVLAAPSEGQERSVLSLLDPEGRQLTVDGPTRTGSLGDQDLVTGSGQRVQAWGLEVVTGPVRVDLTSEAFDAFLYVLSGSDAVAEDDDSGGELNARICLDEAGSYTVIAASLGGGSGSFQLEVSTLSEETCPPTSAWTPEFGEDVAAALAAVVPQGALTVPSSEAFRFDGNEPRIEGRLVRAWTLAGRAGERYALTHRAPGVDTYLYLTGPGLSQVLRDDDGAGDLDARLCVELPETGTYTVYAAPFSTDDEGALHRLESDAGDDAERACEGSFTAPPGAVVERLLTLDVEGRAVGVGDARAGVLGAGQVHPEAGSPLQAWRLVADPGTRVFVDVVSEAFDPTVRAVWPGLEEERFNDDFGDGCNSRLEFVVPAEGPVTLLPGSWSNSGQGDFLLRVSTDPGPLEGGGCGGAGIDLGGDVGAAAAAWEMVGRFTDPEEALRVGSEAEVELDPTNSTVVQGVRARGWAVEVEEGGDWIVEALSDDVDPVLYLMGPGLDEPLFDDDSAGSLDARIEVVDGEPGRWTVVVGALGEGTGRIRLRVLRRHGAG